MDQNLQIACLKALSDETRLQIMDLLKRGTMCACKILEKFSLSQPTLSYHMKQLVDCGLVTVEKDWKWSYYSVNIDTLSQLAKWFDFAPPCTEKGSCNPN